MHVHMYGALCFFSLWSVLGFICLFVWFFFEVSLHVAKPYLELLMPLPPPSKLLDAGIALSAKLPQHLKQSCLILSVSVEQGVTGNCLELRSKETRKVLTKVHNPQI